MRTIKFRAWDGNQMLEPEDLSQSPEYRKWLGKFDYELMQFTGLKDCNGKEIYEGDLIKILLRFLDCESHEIAIVKFENGCFWFDAEQVGYMDCNWRYHNESDREVIGNIYEDEILLK